jgi:cytochrome oxidase Cu insertion factor (SCO1/SenC/PrrC family)
MKPIQKVLTTSLWVLMVLIMVSVIGAQWFRAQARRDLPVLASAPSFELVDQNEQHVTLASLSGKPWIADFVFTHCAGPCPAMTQKMAELQKSLGDAGVRFVSFSVDPERDTPAALKKYAADFAADESSWQFLTGSKDAVFGIARGMLLTALPANEENPIIHDERFVLIDSAGKIRGFYHAQDAEKIAALKDDAARLASEQ